jgi:hypothetical protein
MTACPLCDATATPLLPASTPGELAPKLAGVTPSFDKAIFESERALTADAPPGPGQTHLFEWDGGTVRLAGRIPVGSATECDDSAGPACVAADVSVAGQGAGTLNGSSHIPSLTPHTISDGSDGHTRVFFTQPTDSSGTTADPLGWSGNVYMRVDEHQTVQLNASEATSASAFAPATFLDASSDGSRAFFSSTAQLTNDAPAGGTVKLYMYDSTKPAAALDNLTMVSSQFDKLIGLSDDGHYVYLLAAGVELWHDGVHTTIGTIQGGGFTEELATSGSDASLRVRLSRVTPDGKHLLFTAYKGQGLTGYNHGSCKGLSCREFYVYSADTGALACASCNPTGKAATVDANTVVRAVQGGSATSTHQNMTLTNDGSEVFFNTAEALVPEDTNGVIDAYEFDVAAKKVHLLSSGTSAYPSWFLDASATGRDAFILTRDRLVGWDRDGAYDLYDARGAGGFPEPPPSGSSCTGDSCHGAPSSAPSFDTPPTVGFSGPGNLSRAQKLSRALKKCKSKHKRPLRKKCESSAKKSLGRSK